MIVGVLSTVKPVTAIPTVPYDNTVGLKVLWTPLNDSAITSYQVQNKTASTKWSTPVAIRVYHVHLTGLEPGTIYSVRVRAVSHSENGSWSSPVQNTTFYC